MTSLALSIGAAALLASCGGSQPPIGALGAMPQRGNIGSSSSYQVLYRFNGHPDGAHAEAGLISVKGSLYGTTAFGGRHRAGTIFSISATGAQKTLYSFSSGSDGANPVTGLINVDGTLYGTTNAGGGPGCYKKRGCGTVFSFTPGGGETVLHRFKGGNGSKDGKYPNGLIAVNGILYGTTSEGGGSGCEGHGCGTVFSLTTTGAEKILYSFLWNQSDGGYPRAALIDVKGTLYGTTSTGGAENYGTVFSISTAGAEKMLYSFRGGSDGLYPLASLINLNGTLYGTTLYGGGYDCTGNSCGTVFSITTTGMEHVLYRFQSFSDGAFPWGGLIAVDGTLYGTTYEGGGSGCGEQNGCGTVFSVTTLGTKNLQYNLSDADGVLPTAGLVDVKGVLYGTTAFGGESCPRHGGCGTVFAFTP